MTQSNAAPVLSPPNPETQATLLGLIDSFLNTQLIYAAVRLGVPSALGHDARTAADIAGAVGVEERRLHRLMRGLAAIGLLEEGEGGVFGLTEMGRLLHPDAPGSMAGPALARGDAYYPAATHLADALLAGEVPFERGTGVDFFTYAQRNPEIGRSFQASMTARSRREAEGVVQARDFSEFPRIVDIGGGTGVLLEAILNATPGSTGVLFDLPSVARLARQRLAGQPVASRIEVEGGDFFAAAPPGGDCYLLSRILHDWNDDDAIRILRSVRDAMPSSGRLMIVEAVLPERAVDEPATIRMDLLMLVLVRGEERTAGSFERLLDEAGFALTAIQPIDSHSGVHLLEARPAP
jgi:hypothetical protein